MPRPADSLEHAQQLAQPGEYVMYVPATYPIWCVMTEAERATSPLAHVYPFCWATWERIPDKDAS